MTLNFNQGLPFIGDSKPSTALTAAGLRDAIRDTALHLEGEAIILPLMRDILEVAGVSTGAIYGRGLAYEEAIAHATGLTIVRSSGYMLVNAETEIEPLKRHMRAPRRRPK